MEEQIQQQLQEFTKILKRKGYGGEFQSHLFVGAFKQIAEASGTVQQVIEENITAAIRAGKRPALFPFPLHQTSRNGRGGFIDCLFNISHHPANGFGLNYMMMEKLDHTGATINIKDFPLKSLEELPNKATAIKMLNEALANQKKKKPRGPKL